MRRLAWLWVLLLAAASSRLASRAQAQASDRLTFTAASPIARDAVAAAWTDFQHGYVQRARTRARNALAIDPDLGVARALAAKLATDLNDGQRRSELNRGVADAARASTAEQLVAATLRASVIDPATEAAALADAAVALLPGDPAIALLRVMVLPLAPDRLDRLTAITRRHPDFPPALGLVAQGQLAAGDTAGALRSVGEYVRLAPDHPSAHASYGEILHAAGRPGEAHAHFRQSVEIDPSFATGHAGIASVNVTMKQYVEAIPIMRRALALDPQMMSGYELIAQAHLYLGDPAQARAVLLQSGERAPSPERRITQQTYAALTFVHAGAPRDAIQGLADVATSAEQQELGPQAATVHRTMALLEATLGERRFVDGHLNRAARLSPPGASPQPEALWYAALCQAVSGQTDRARRSAKELGDLAAAGTPADRRNSREANAVVAIAERNLDRARTELEEAGPAPLGRALFAEALMGAGRSAEARAIRDDLLTRPLGPTIFDVIARYKMQRT